MLPALLLAAALAHPLDGVLRVDPVPTPGPLTAEVAFRAAAPGGEVTTFSGTCPWPDPARPLVHRWKGILPGDGPRILRHLRITFRDGAGKVVATVFKDPGGRVDPRGLRGLVLHVVPGVAAGVFDSGEVRLELEIGGR
ncbi:hypothetical protein [Mesoterricola sediminis]|uniref:Uncharacterized protein n=1 Tax=Mesoterricola sediminis TaxID=2927980 RepID=A0AA48GU85_9BACT|nr:hypothetical protein [Mesoterricola sediminis]BDU75745.1 hypothetical protein METESE_07030 [Mesoterricola sediminis]